MILEGVLSETLKTENGKLKSMDIESRVQEIGRKLLETSSKEQPGFFNKNFWSGKMMDWAMKQPKFKVELFRFVDVLPMLKDSTQISEHIKAYFMRPDIELSPIVKSAMGVASSGGLFSKIASGSIKSNVQSMAKGFIVGENARASFKSLKKLWNNGLSFTVDILGEAVVSEEEAEDYFHRYLDLINELPDEASTWSSQDLLEKIPGGKTPRVNVSIKCSSLYSQIDSYSFRDSVEGIKERLRKLLRAAVEKNVFIYLDMEQNDLREILLTVAEELYAEDEFKDYPHFGIVIQAYLKCALNDLLRLKKFVDEKRKTPLYVRLVKGAYWDYENILASQRNWETPVFVKKEDTDYNYERCVDCLVENYPSLIPAFASHNLRSLSYAMACAEHYNLPENSWELQMLYGMADPFKKVFQEKNIRIREYAPVGEMLPGMAYLVRRLLENTSNEGFLKAKFVDGAHADKLLKKPVLSEFLPGQKKDGFATEALQDFGLLSVRSDRDRAIENVKKTFPVQVKPVVSGVAQETECLVTEPCPFDLKSTVAQVHYADQRIAEKALQQAVDAQEEWSARTPLQRIECFRRAASLMRERKYDLAATMLYEVGKDFREADGDVCEAIDFCEYYANQYEEMVSGRKMGEILGEDNFYSYRSRGPAVVISPWNFPLAILCGMTVAPLLCGNTVVMKPAEQACLIAKKFFDILLEAGVPSSVISFVPGKGREVGAFLVADRRTHLINFTGSREVGLEIIEKSAKLQEGQKHIKKVLAELGGKNALIVDDDADLDEAVHGALYSAFAFQGQKCSALSRLIVHEKIYDLFKKRMIEALRSMAVGALDNPVHKIGPVVNAAARDRLMAVIERNKDSIVFTQDLSEELMAKGLFVPPTIFESHDFSSELGQQEFFGPLLTLFKVSSLDEAIEKANDVDYALTGGVFSRNPDHIEKVKKSLEVGNLYINRSITGALVGRQPFGGFKLSGVGAKAGGPDYLLQFLEPYTHTENTMRRGFSPDL